MAVIPSFQATKPGKRKLHESSSMANAKKDMSRVATATTTRADVHEKTDEVTMVGWLSPTSLQAC